MTRDRLECKQSSAAAVRLMIDLSLLTTPILSLSPLCPPCRWPAPPCCRLCHTKATQYLWQSRIWCRLSSRGCVHLARRPKVLSAPSRRTCVHARAYRCRDDYVPSSLQTNSRMNAATSLLRLRPTILSRRCASVSSDWSDFDGARVACMREITTLIPHGARRQAPISPISFLPLSLSVRRGCEHAHRGRVVLESPLH